MNPITVLKLDTVIKELSALKEQLLDKQLYPEVCILRDNITALQAMQGVKGPEISELIRDLVGNPGEESRKQFKAAKDLGERGRGARDAIPALIDTLRSENKALRKAAAWALERIFSSN
jgi:HEAT repeat protein